MSIGNSSMTPVIGAGWSRGLSNVLRGELNSWFSTRRWWVQIIVWAACVNLILFLVALSTPKERISMDTTLMLFNIFLGLAGPIGVSILMQTVVVGEKRSGTAAWVLSKPVSRVAFIVAKLIANGAGIAVTMILAQGLIAYLISTFMLGFSLSMSGFLAALGVHFVNILFYLTLTLLLGTIFESTGPVIGIPISFLFVQNISMSFFPALVRYIPWTLAIPANGATNPSIAMNLMAGIAVPSFMPLYVALAAMVLFIGLALWIFQRQEF
jgi:ABC-2 type transport system permease protein